MSTKRECGKINVNGETYIREDLVVARKLTEKPAKNECGHPYVIIRSYGAGVFAGYLAGRDDMAMRVTMNDCIRMHRWTGCSLSQVANDGIAGAGENRFAMPTQGHEIFQVIEIIPCTEKARTTILAVPTWKM